MIDHVQKGENLTTTRVDGIFGKVQGSNPDQDELELNQMINRDCNAMVNNPDITPPMNWYSTGSRALREPGTTVQASTEIVTFNPQDREKILSMDNIQSIKRIVSQPSSWTGQKTATQDDWRRLLKGGTINEKELKGEFELNNETMKNLRLVLNEAVDGREVDLQVNINREREFLIKHLITVSDSYSKAVNDHEDLINVRKVIKMI